MLALDRTTHQRLTAELPATLRAAADQSYQQFENTSPPSSTEEIWRYVEVPEGLEDLTIPEAPGGAPTPGVLPGLLGDLAGRADLVDGHLIEFEGDRLTPLSAADGPSWPTPAPDRFAAAARAFGGSGLVITSERGEFVEAPVYVSMEAITPGVVTIPRVVVRAAEASQIALIVEQRSDDGLETLVLPDFEVYAGPSARVSVTVVQTWGAETTAVGSHRFRADQGAHVELAEAGLGGRFSRLHLTVDLVGRGADARVVGAYFGDDEQTLDYRYFVNHAGPNTTSEMFLKGAVAGDSRSVFTGLIRIEPEGQGTNAHQTNRNLVLSDGAEAHSVPNLEILANDVRCGHGSAVGPLDEEQRYYLMSRGLPRPRADRLQVLGFFEEALTRFPHLSIEPHLRAAAMSKYDRATR